MSGSPLPSDVVSMSKALVVLQKARKLIERGWAKRYMALNQDGDPTLPDYPNACKWCLGGAIFASMPAMGTDTHTLAIYHIREELVRTKNPCVHITDFNDDEVTTKEDVLSIIDGTILKIQNLIDGHTTIVHGDGE